MTLIRLEGFENTRTKAALENRYPHYRGGWESVAGRNPPGFGLKGTHANSGVAELGVLDLTQFVAGGVIGFGFWADQLVDDRPILTIEENPAATHISLVVVHVNSAQFKLKLVRGPFGGVSFGTTTSVFSYREWHHIELKFTIGNSTGDLDLRVDGVSVLTASSGSDTQNGGTADWTGFILHSYANTLESGSGAAFDDIYVLTRFGTVADFLGDRIVEGLTVTGDGASSQFTASSDGPNYQDVDDANDGDCDEDGTFVTTSSDGDRDLYVFKDLGLVSQGILGIEVHADMRKNGSANQDMEFVIYNPATTAASKSANVPITRTSYRNKGECWSKNPFTNQDWSVAEINSHEFGIEN